MFGAWEEGTSFVEGVEKRKYCLRDLGSEGEFMSFSRVGKRDIPSIYGELQ